MGELQATVKTLSTELGEKIGEIQKQDKTVRDLQTSQVKGHNPELTPVEKTKLFFRELWLKGWLGERLPSKPSLTRRGI